MTITTEDIEAARIRAEQARAAAILAEKDLADTIAASRPQEPTQEGTVITFQRQYRTGDPYTFAAILLAGDWFTTGTRTQSGGSLVWENIVAKAVPGSIKVYREGVAL